jgi:hypothetical protein
VFLCVSLYPSYVIIRSWAICAIPSGCGDFLDFSGSAADNHLMKLTNHLQEGVQIMRTVLLTGLLSGLVWLAVGNQWCAAQTRSWSAAHAGSCASCGDNYDEGYAPPSRSVRSAGGDCDDCGYPYRSGVRACGDCCGSTCHDRTYCGPLSFIFGLFTRDCWSGPGCGERYWGDYYSDPPDRCEPCDRMNGRFIGGSGYRSDRYVGNSSLGGYAGGYASGGYVNGASHSGKPCANCNKRQAAADYDLPQDAQIVSQDERIVEPNATPTPAKPHKATSRPQMQQR